ncbi:MAG: flagellar biosynthesis anti-sigma factor FlgM [Clostridiales bacterium]|nr:flagellar biosynthesis anti-sigma factor FlgM [Clostridiales bacterium]
MRIDAFNKVSQLYQQNSTQKVMKSNAVSKRDRVEISQLGKDIQVAKQVVAQAPDIRQDKVNEIKQRMASGKYNVSTEEIADKMIKDFFE